MLKAGRSHLQPLQPVGGVGTTSRSDAPAPRVGGRTPSRPPPSSSAAEQAMPLPPSRVPPEFHIKSASGRLVFPTEAPTPHEVGHLANALGLMLEEWERRLAAAKPGFPLDATLWGVLQMIVYDIWSTIEESRIWDIALLETQRQAASVSPPLAQMVGRARQRLSQLFEAVLAMSQRLQFELQRWHSQWVSAEQTFKSESRERHGLHLKHEKLLTKLATIENASAVAAAVADGAAGGAAGAAGATYEKTLRRLQQESGALRAQVRTLTVHNQRLRGREVELKLAAEALEAELDQWRGKLQRAAAEARTQPILANFAAMAPAEQRACLDALHAEAARSSAAADGGGGGDAPAADAPAAPAAGGADAPDGSAAAPAAAGGDGAAAATVAEQRADALHSIVDQLTEAEAELLAELLATRTAQAWDPGVASRAEAGLA